MAPENPFEGELITLSATFEGHDTATRATESNYSFAWEKDDEILVFTTGSNKKFIANESGKTTTFQGGLDTGTEFNRYAVYPYRSEHALADDKLTIYLPDSYVKSSKVESPMISSLDKNSRSLSFKHVGVVLKLTLNNIPAGATKMVFQTKAGITGKFDLQGDQIVVGQVNSYDKVTVTFDETNEVKSGEVFYIPVPTGKIPGFDISVYNKAGERVAYSSELKEYTFLRADMGYKDINFTNVDGTITPTVTVPEETTDATETLSNAVSSVTENPSVDMSTPPSVTAVSLPAVFTDENTTDSKLDVNYTEAPKTVTVSENNADSKSSGESKGEVNVLIPSAEAATVSEMNINTPSLTASVQAKGEEMLTIENMTAETADNTLIIGKNVTVNKLTVNGGNVVVRMGGKIGELVVGEGVRIVYVYDETNEMTTNADKKYMVVGSVEEAALRSVMDKGGSFTLKENMQLGSPLIVSSNAELNLGGMSMTPKNSTLAAVAGTASTDALVVIRRGGKLTLGGQGTLSTEDKLDYAIKLTDGNDVASDTDKAELVINDGPTVYGKGFAISGNGLSNRHNTAITVNGGFIKSDHTAIYHPQAGTVIINSGAVLEGVQAAVEMRSGTLTLYGGRLSSTAQPLESEENGSGNTTSGAAVAISQHETDKDLSLIIPAGSTSELTGYYAVYEEDKQNENVSNISMSVSGGKFNGMIGSENLKKFISGGAFSHPSALDYLNENANVTVQLDKKYEGPGFGLYDGGNGDNATVAVDLNNNTWTVDDPLHGSAGTVTQSFHFEQGAKVSISNGTITVPKGGSTKMLIQNYCDLTLTDVTLDGQNLNPKGSDAADETVYKRYVLSNNNGTTTLTRTNINAGPNFAFDVYHNLAKYPSGVNVILDGGVINGDVEVFSNGNDANKCKLTIKGGSINVTEATSDARKAAISAEGPAIITMEGGSVSAAPQLTSDPKVGQYGVALHKGASFTMTGGTIESSWYAVSGNGKVGLNEATINISGEAKLKSTADYAVYLPHKGVTTISGGTIEGKTGAVATRYDFGQELNISGGTFIGTGEGSTGDWANGTGKFSNAALMLKGTAKVDITGGSFDGGSGGPGSAAVSAHEKVTVNISNGTFTVGADNNNQGNSCIYAKESAKVYISGGSFSSAAKYADRYWVLNRENASGSTAVIDVTGGTFTKFNPARPVTDDMAGNSYTYLNSKSKVECSDSDVSVEEAWKEEAGEVTYTVSTPSSDQ